MTMQMKTTTYYPLSMVAGKNGDYEHAVYITGRHCLFHHNGKAVSRIIKKAAGWLEYVVYKGERYYVDDACTLR